MDKDFNCCDCGLPISDGVARYSFKRFGREFCISCQKSERFKDSPKKLAESFNKMVDKKYKKGG